MKTRAKELFHKDKRELVNKIINLEKQIKVLEPIITSRLQDALYQFIDYYTDDEMNRVDMQIIAENFIEFSFPQEIREEEWL